MSISNNFPNGILPTIWTPAEMTIPLWLDGNVSGSIQSSGGLVSQWDDQSGNGNNALQVQGAYQPNDGTNHVEFAVSKGMYIDNNPFLNTQNPCFVALTTRDQKSSNYQNFIASCGGIGTGFSLQQRKADVHDNRFQTFGVTPINYLDDVTDRVVLTEPWIGAAIRQNANYKAIRFTGLVGVSEVSGASVTYDADDYAAIGCGIRTPTPETFPPERSLIGKIYEIIFQDNMITADIEKLEGYMAWKWSYIFGNMDLVDALPVGHTYKAGPPLL